eukprot:TRINITY_DN738_c0_g1::TRINITY_DN738_c0_g1_i1::g.18346::m.18346 TRINITY_DN738_c0_g1::TRINITY_DN738_c0_g1_i1::g.18346  ORF type:complete len:289 (+),score=17.35,NTF2/PF02136.15/3.2e+02,NTF2/PF02136.15/0.16,SRP_SPB/PF02978.14/0.097 TRINITY_DN738_c0_g1_i1:116-982(+)
MQYSLHSLRSFTQSFVRNTLPHAQRLPRPSNSPHVASLTRVSKLQKIHGSSNTVRGFQSRMFSTQAGPMMNKAHRSNTSAHTIGTILFFVGGCVSGVLLHKRRVASPSSSRDELDDYFQLLSSVIYWCEDNRLSRRIVLRYLKYRSRQGEIYDTLAQQLTVNPEALHRAYTTDANIIRVLTDEERKDPHSILESFESKKAVASRARVPVVDVVQMVFRYTIYLQMQRRQEQNGQSRGILAWDMLTSLCFMAADLHARQFHTATIQHALEQQLRDRQPILDTEPEGVSS